MNGSRKRVCLYCGEEFAIGPRDRGRLHCYGWCRDSYYRRKQKPRDPADAPKRPTIVDYMSRVEFSVCADCGGDRCRHSHAGMAPSPEQIAAAKEVVKMANIAAGVMR